jgi:hypothetical protein
VEKNIKTAVAALRSEIWKAAEQRRIPRRNDRDVLEIAATFWSSVVLQRFNRPRGAIRLRRETSPDMTNQDDSGNS